MIDWLDQYEVCANVWPVMDVGTGTVCRFGVRLYALTGAEQTKLAALKTLAPSDFVAARWFPVPKSFVLVGPSGDEAPGIAAIADLRETMYWQSAVESAWEELPPLYIWRGAEATKTCLPLPQDVLYVETVLVEDTAGTLRPMVGAQAGTPRAVRPPRRPRDGRESGVPPGM